MPTIEPVEDDFDFDDTEKDKWRCDACGGSFKYKWPKTYPVNGRKCPLCKSEGAMPDGY